MPLSSPCVRHAARTIAVAMLLLAGGRLADAQPSLSHALPGAVLPGTTTEITLHGAKLDGEVRVWTSFPARVEVVSGDPNQKDRAQVQCKVTLAAGTPVGIGGIAVATPAGLSDVAYLMIDDLPSAADNGNNHAPQSPQDVQLPLAVDGTCDGTLNDYYRFTASAGQKISCEVLATRLGWDFDPFVRLLDAGGNELLRADDDASTGADARFVFTAPADGPYTLELRDNRYKPGGRYRLRLGSFPLVSTPVPPVAAVGAVNRFTFAGPSGDVAPLDVLIAGAVAGQPLSLNVRGASDQASGLASLATTELTVVAESASSDKPDEATPATLPCIVSGTLEAEGDRDLVQFEAKKGTPIRFTARTRSLGSAAIVILRVLNSAGNQLAESAITDSDEPILDFTVPEDGTYKLAIEELAGRSGPDYVYAIECRPGPQFTLLLKNDKSNKLKYALPASGGAFTLDVQCQRFAYDGPIALAIDSPRPGWQVFNSVIPAKANEVRLYVIPPHDLAAGELAPLSIVGRATDANADCAATMSTLVQLRAARPQTPYPPAWHDGMVFVGGHAAGPSFYRVTADRQEVNFPRLVGQTQLALTFERTDPNFKDVPLTVLPLDLPAGMTAEVKRNGNGPEETYDIILKGPKDLAEGQHTLRYFAYAQMGEAGRGVLGGDIRLNVITPLAVTLAPAGPLPMGQKQKLKVTLTRRGDDKQPVDVAFKSLPAGVTAPEKTTLAADQNEIEIELTAATDAAATKFEQLVAVATSKYAGTDITVESPAGVLEVKAP